MSNLAENATIENDEVEEWASSIFNPPKHRFQKVSPSRKKQKLDDTFKLECSTPPRSLRDDDIAIKLSLSQDENNVVDSWNYPRASPKSFQDGLFTSGTFDFSLPATPPRAGTDLDDVDLASPPEIRKHFSLDAHKMSSPRFPTFPAGDVQQLIAALSPKKEGGSMFQEIQGRIQHLSPGQTLYNVASNSDEGSPCRPLAWGLQDEQAKAEDDNSHCFNPPQSELRKSRVSDSIKAVSVTQHRCNETSSPAMLQHDMHHHHYLKTADFTPDTKLSTPNAVTNVSSSDSTIQYNTPSTWSQAPLPPFVSHKGESAHPELLPRPPFRGWNPTPQFISQFNTGYDKASHHFYPDRAHSSFIDDDHIWSRNQALLRMFQSRFGHCNVPEGYGVGTEYEGLHSWCQDQRAEYHRMCRGEPTTMTPSRRNILMEIGFAGVGDNIRKKRTASVSTRAAWSKWMEKLTEYRAKHGNVDVPLKYEPCPSLGTFVNRQRTELRKMEAGKASSLTPARIQDLNKLGFTWALRESHVSWEDRYEELKEFKDTNGELVLFLLYLFCVILCLVSLILLRRSSFNNEGHCNVPKQYPKNPALGYWVNEQRSQYRRFVDKKPSYMTEDKIQALKEIGFKWSMREVGNGTSNWDDWLKQLRAYKDEHGDTDVSLKYAKNPSLGAFVNRQRTEYRKMQQGAQSSLTEERIKSLDELGFKWQMRVSRTPWEQRLKELREFKEVHGHCNVPSTWSENQPLAYWVFKQRGQYRMFKQGLKSGNRNSRCNMTADRIAQLDILGFEWAPSRKASSLDEN